MAPDNFHLFPGLPLEIQDRIWEICLPRRVISPCYGPELQNEFVLPPGRIPYLPVSALIPFRPPLISQVCTRARAATKRCGQFTPVLVYADTNRFSTHESAWLNKNTDWIYLTLSTVQRCLGRRQVMDGDAASRLFELARDVRRPLLISSMISEDVMEPLNDEMDEKITSKLYNQFLIERKHFYYVMVEAHLVVSREDHESVVKTGLFGLLGEDIAIVPYADKQTLQRYASLYDLFSVRDTPYNEDFPIDLNIHFEGKDAGRYEPRTLIRRLLEDICEERRALDQDPEEIASVEDMLNEDNSLKSDHPRVKQLGITMPTCEKVVIFELRVLDTLLQDAWRISGLEGLESESDVI